MTEPRTSPSEPPGALELPALEYRGQRILLREGSLVVGRSAECHVVLDDPLASRRHARFIVMSGRSQVEDLGSANGTYLNDRKLNGIANLLAGDRVLIGQQELVFVLIAAPRRAARHLAQTLNGAESPPAPADLDSTDQRDTLHLLGAVAEKSFSLGRGEEAERILMHPLELILQRAKGSDANLPAELCERAGGFAVRLATATTKARWVDYCFELYLARRQPLPATVADGLYAAVRHVVGVNRDGFRAYVAVLRELQPKLGPAERFLALRCEGLSALFR